MTTREKIFLGLLIFVVALYLFGPPKSFSFFGFTWETQECESVIDLSACPVTTGVQEVKPQVYAKDALTIENLKSSQQMYALNDAAFVDFKVIDDMNLPYNFTVNWFYNGTFGSWYNESNVTWPVSAYYKVGQKGEWKVQVILKWSYANRSYSKDAITSFEVS